jgi:hypothetical protein
MIFLKIRRGEEMLRRTTTKPGLIVAFALVAAAASVGYVVFLAILAPQQLAEATAAATDLVCSRCVGTSDIADSAVISAKIGSGQVGNSDIANNAVGTAKIGSGQVGNSDLASSAVTSSKISDTSGVQSVDIVNGQVASADIADGTITSTDIARGAIKPKVLTVHGVAVTLVPGEQNHSFADCPLETILTGGGFQIGTLDVKIYNNYPYDATRWVVSGVNQGTSDAVFQSFAQCALPSP